MSLLERLLNRIGGGRKALLGAVSQPSPMNYLYLVRARAFQKITGRPLTTTGSLTIGKSQTSASDSIKDLSPSRRLLRKGLE